VDERAIRSLLNRFLLGEIERDALYAALLTIVTERSPATPERAFDLANKALLILFEQENGDWTDKEVVREIAHVLGSGAFFSGQSAVAGEHVKTTSTVANIFMESLFRAERPSVPA